MKALKLYGVEDLRYEDNEKPVIESVNDVIVKVRATGNMWFRHVTIQKNGAIH